MKYVKFSLLSLFIIVVGFLITKDTYLFIMPLLMINSNIYRIFSILIFLLVNFVIFRVYLKNSFVLGRKLEIILLLNILFYYLFNIFTYRIVSPFLSFASKTFQFTSALHLNEEVILQNKTSAKYLVPYIIWTFYLTLVSLFTFFINNT